MLWFAVGVRSRGFVPRLSVVSVTSLVVVGGLRAWLRVCYCCVYREVFSVELSCARLGFSLLHVDVWSEDGCRRRTGLCAYLLPHGGALSFPCAFLLRCRGALVDARCLLLSVLACGACIFSCPRVGAAHFLLIVYNGVQFEETKRKEVAS